MLDCAPVAEKANFLPDTTYGAILRGQLKRPEQLKSGRQLVAALSLVSLSLAWIGVLVTTGQLHEALAWVFSFSACAFVTVGWLIASGASHRLSLFRIGENRQATLAGSLAVTLAVFSG